MASSDQIKSLIRAHVEQNDEKFRTVVLQIAASEARQGHEIVARELKQFADKLLLSKRNIVKINNSNTMFLMTMPNDKLSNLVVSDDIWERIIRILHEFRNQNKLKNYGLCNRRKILLEGKPGTGKTYTASVIASELSLPLYTIQMDRIVTKFMGETSAKLRQAFDTIETVTGVYLFDEFYSIGANRNIDNEVGEARRILNSFLQYLEQDNSDSIIIAATNNQRLLDQALFRRFDDVLHYTMPSEREIRRLLEMKLGVFAPKYQPSDDVVVKAKGLSHAEIVRACDDAIKESILSGKEIEESFIFMHLQERKNAYSAEEA